MPLYIPLPFIIFYSFLLGTFFGSFANVLAFRLPLGKSIAMPPSFCPTCEKRIQLYDLVPVASYFVLMGKCRHCKAKIPPRYLIVEIFSGLLFAATAFLYPLPVAVFFAVLAFALLVVALVDIQVQEIPDSMLALMIVAAVCWIIVDPASIRPIDALIGAAAGAIPLFLLDQATQALIKKDGFGYGDVKLFGTAGLFLGWQGVLAAYFVAFITGAIAAIFMLGAKKTKRGGYIAFGPFICLGTIAAAWSHTFFGEHLISFFLIVNMLI